MLSPSTIADSVIGFHEQQTEEIEVFWIEWSGSRQQLVSDLKSLMEGRPVMITTVGIGRFFDPDGIVDDLSLTIQENAGWFTPTRRELVIRDEKFSVVLVSKRPLGVPQLSSPVSLPDWFPLWPSKLLMANIKSIRYAVTLTLASTDIPEADINNSLFALEQALGSRLDAVLQSHPAGVNALQAAIGTSPQTPATIAGLVASSKAGVQSRTGDEFRPGGAMDSGFIVSQLARIWRDCPPKERQALATYAADALGIDGSSTIDIQFSLTSLLTRGKEKLPTTPVGITFCRNLLGTVSDVVQFVNGRHHADEFPRFPAVLTITLAAELASSCRKAARTISELA